MNAALPTQSTRDTPWKRRDHLMWLTGMALVLCMLAIVTVVGIIVANGAVIFWPQDVVLYQLKDGRKLLAIERQREKIPPGPAREQGLLADPHRHLVMVGNRDLYGQDFVWVNHMDMQSTETPANAWVMERREYGNFIGYLKSLQLKGRRLEGREAEAALPSAVDQARKIFEQIYKIEKIEIGKINARMEKVRLEGIRMAKMLTGITPVERLKKIEEEKVSLQKKYETCLARVTDLRKEGMLSKVEVTDIQGTSKELSLLNVIDAWQPNRMGLAAKAAHYLEHLIGFLTDDPREANTEGGVFPAIFGTTIMVILMSLAVVPFGVLTAFYLCEYARQGPMVRIVRIALNNLAGVPSIVYGVFGLGFFVYFVGGGIDRLFYPEALPTPTWGTGGILWASLTLALLTVPVVVMATEESISSVPRGMREGSLALGASKFQTLCRILLPASLPGILTGVILAMARGAGEVAPLMITGVVKLAPSLPLDGLSPFIHLERKFMHLGFHIYDVGFQSPNVEASRPMVFASAMLLILLVIALNLGAILLRDRVRRKYLTGAFN